MVWAQQVVIAYSINSRREGGMVGTMNIVPSIKEKVTWERVDDDAKKIMKISVSKETSC